MAVNVNDLFEDLLWRLKTSGKVQNSRNGKVLALNEPTMFKMVAPMQRVLYHPRRKCNPYLHVMESIWMLGGGKDVKFLLDFSKQMGQYAEPDTGQINGAYGHRWRMHFGRDQLMGIIRELRHNHDSRQAVLAMYDPTIDYLPHWRDRPCNTHIYFRVVDNQLDMTVCNRSNDLVWGACGANAVHMTYMMEFIARALNLQMGTYYVMSNNLHIYEPHWHLLDSPGNYTEYARVERLVPVYDNEQSPWEFLEECRLFLEHGVDGSYRSPWINGVVIPMYEHYMCRLNGDKVTYDTTETEDDAWRIAEDKWQQWHDSAAQEG